jgi:Protein of unknown function (DUF3179)
MTRLFAIALWMCAALMPVQAQRVSDTLLEQSLGLFDDNPAQFRRALDTLVATGRRDVAPTLILAMRFAPPEFQRPLSAGLEKLTKAKPGSDWADWMVWQEKNPETGVMPEFAALHATMHRRIDPKFDLFLKGDKKHDIRIEEITWGGVIKDGIPALTNPRLVQAGEATYLGGDDLVFGVVINGDARAYPLRIMDWHEMFNDVIGGVPVSLAYCTLCGSGILFDTTVPGVSAPFVFGSSGFLYRSNKLMYDTATNSLWNQFTGKPVVGDLTGSGIELKTRPVVITKWSDWQARNPSTKVLALNTGFPRDYRAGAAYGRYFSSPDLMFPAAVDQRKLKQKDFVFALRSSGAEKAWPLKLFQGGAVINDKAGVVELTLIGDAATRTVRAYRSEGLAFRKGPQADGVLLGQETWKVTEEALVSPSGRSLPRLPGHIAYWFAWSGYLGKTGEVAESGKK